MKAWFTRIRQAVSGRLMTLKHKFGKAQFQKYRALFHARRLEARDWMKESWLIVKCAVLIALCKLQMALTPEALRSYRQWLKNLPSRFTKENFQKWGAAFLAWLKSLPSKLRSMRKSGLLASLTLFALLLFMGHASSVAWLTYTTPAEQNNFQVGHLNVYVEYKNDQTNGKYLEVTPDSALFNDEALYEPGYTQVVYLKINNRGNIPLDYKIVVHDFKSTDSINVYGDTLHLPDHLNFGLVTASTEQELQAKISPRDFARLYATHRVAAYMPNQEYSIPSSRLEVNCEEYAALIVWMPTKVGNEANYKTGETIPQVTLGVTVHAQQINTMTNE